MKKFFVGILTITVIASFILIPLTVQAENDSIENVKVIADSADKKAQNNAYSIIENSPKYSMNFVTGAINSKTGKIIPASIGRASTKDIIDVTTTLEIGVDSDNWVCQVFYYDADGGFIKHSDSDHKSFTGIIEKGTRIRISLLNKKNRANGTEKTIGYSVNELLSHLNLTYFDEEVKDIGNRFKDIERLFSTGKNLLDIDENSIIDNSFFNGKTIQQNSRYFISNPIKVKAGDKLTISKYVRKITLFDIAEINADSIVLEHKDVALSGNPYTYTAPHDGYVRCSIYRPYMDSIQIESGEKSTDYEPYRQILDNMFGLYNTLAGKKWAVCGDSFSAGGSPGEPDNIITSGKYKGQNKVYSYLIANRNNMEIQKLFAGGRTLAKPADGSFTNTLVDIYKNIDPDVDYITIYLGINDSHHRPNATGSDGENVSGVIPLGTPEDEDSSTFYGAWNVILPYLIENYPFAKIGILVSNGVETEDYRTATIEMAKKYGIPYIDLNGDERTPCMIRSVNSQIDKSIRDARTAAQAVRMKEITVDNGDGTSTTYPVNKHPNVAAHEYESYFIEEFLRSL